MSKISTLTSKFQATIPKEIRQSLGLKTGDKIIFQLLEDKTVLIKKATPFDKEYLELLNMTLNEWKSEHDEEDFKHLQDL